MAGGDLDSGSKYGLTPIGLPQADLETGRSDTERRSFPGLATKSSVFAWTSDATNLINTTAAGTVTINLRQNTATGGSSVDVPTWAAGAYVQFSYSPLTMGTSTYHFWSVNASTSVLPSGAYLWTDIKTAAIVAGPASGWRVPLIVPFFDEPVFTTTWTTNGTGTSGYAVILLGFVRNV